MTDDLVTRYRNSREWLNGGECCGDKDGSSTCAAPACIFGEAVKELQTAASRIEQLEAALRKIAQHDMQAIAIDALHPNERVRTALEEKKDD
jgi:hypothetical protein